MSFGDYDVRKKDAEVGNEEQTTKVWDSKAHGDDRICNLEDNL